MKIKLKIRILLIAVFTLTTPLLSQNNETNNKLTLAVWLNDDIEVPLQSRKLFENKLLQIVSNNGLSGSSDRERFIITANINVMNKEITNTNPVMYVYNLSVDYYAGDGFEGKSFSTYSTSIKGVGENEIKAFSAAIKSINPKSKEFAEFLNNTKKRIAEYVNSQCDINIKKARYLATTNQFDEALWLLTSIPEAFEECFNKSMDVAAEIFKQKIDFEGKQKLQQATAIWNAGQNWEAAEKAGKILASINPNSAVIDDMKILTEKIEKRINAVDKREWDFNYDYSISLKKDMINAIRDVGVAYGNGQPQNQIYKSFW